MKSLRNGKLILLALPIGNLDDITIRVKSALESGKYFVAEDTRKFKQLLNLLDIPLKEQKISSFHDHSKESDKEKVLKLLDSGHQVYMVSEAGEPLICDPAYPIIRMAIEKNFQVESFPGPSALINSLTVSGLPPYPCHFHGFYPRDTEKRRDFIDKVYEITGTHILFESPARVVASVNELVAAFPDASFCLARELTKKFETVLRFNASEWEKTQEELRVQGEFVILFYVPQNKKSHFNSKISSLAQQLYESGAKPKLVAKLIAHVLNKPIDETYSKLFKN